MAQITLTLTKTELIAAVRDYCKKRGFDTTDRFTVTVRTIPGDRPFDSEYTETTVTGVLTKECLP